MASVDPAQTEVNQGATGAAPAEPGAPEPSGDAGPAGAGAPINQGAPGAGPEGSSAYEPGAGAYGESSLSVGTESDAFADRPELFVGAAFAGGLTLAMILRRFAR